MRGQYFDTIPYDWMPRLDGPLDTLKALTDWGQATHHVYGLVTYILVGIFFAVFIPFLWVLLKFRVKDETVLPLPPQTRGSAFLEVVWTVVPVILLILIAIPTWQAIFKMGEKPSDGIFTVEVVGHQWWWEFRYPQLGITTAEEVHLPEDTPIQFRLSSADVIHSFWIPQWGGKIDALPGVSHNRIVLTTPKAREKGGDWYEGVCAELCGLSHALMRFHAVVHTKDEFDRWAKSHNEPPQVRSEIEKRGEQLFAVCASCHTIKGTPSEDLEKQLHAMNQTKIGPNLTNFGSRKTLGSGIRKNTEENFITWLRDPEAMKPGSKMKALGMSEEDMKAVAAYVRFSTAKDY